MWASSLLSSKILVLFAASSLVYSCSHMLCAVSEYFTLSYISGDIEAVNHEITMLLHMSHSFCSTPVVDSRGHVPLTKAILFLVENATIIFLFQPLYPLPEKGIGTREIPGISEDCTNKGLVGSGEKLSVLPMTTSQKLVNKEGRQWKERGNHIKVSVKIYNTLNSKLN